MPSRPAPQCSKHNRGGAPPGCSPAPARVFTSWCWNRNRPYRVTVSHGWRDQMSSRAENYHRLGIEARRRAAQAIKPEIRLAFEDVASGWFALAKQVDWLDTRYDAAEREKKE